MAGVLRGLDAAHEARDENARPLDVVHRDVSPQNILVGCDGVARLLDFGIAKAVGRLHTTRDGELKGKVGYMAPEQLAGRAVDRRTDIYAASVVLWEALTGERLFGGDDVATMFGSVMQKKVPAPSTHAADLPPAIDQAVLSGLEREPSRRFARARDMATAIENGAPLARATEIAEWVAMMGEKELAERANVVAGMGRPRAPAMPAAASDSSKNVLVSLASSDSMEGLLTAVGETVAPSAGRRSAKWIGAAAVLFVSAAFAIAMRRGATTPADVAVPLTRGPTTAATSTASAPAVSTAEPSGATERAPEASGPLPISSMVSAKTPAPARASSSARVPGSKSRTAKASACDPPFTIDEIGHKHYKVDCL